MVDSGVPDYLRRPVGDLDPRYASVFDEVTMWSSRFGDLLLLGRPQDHLPVHSQ